jgi:hypothetical protein
MSQVRKVVINTRFGGFSLSNEARSMYRDRKGLADADFSMYEIPRDDADLVAVVEQLGKKADGDYARLKVVEIPADVKWQIEEYDGSEHIAEVHRTWS